jgi:hypothetical protein
LLEQNIKLSRESKVLSFADVLNRKATPVLYFYMAKIKCWYFSGEKQRTVSHSSEHVHFREDTEQGGWARFLLLRLPRKIFAKMKSRKLRKGHFLLQSKVAN